MKSNSVEEQGHRMVWNAKNGSVKLDKSEMSYVSFGYGKKVFIVLPGLSDGLTTVKGKALLYRLRGRMR